MQSNNNFEISSFHSHSQAPTDPAVTADLLRQILEVQTQMLQHMQASAAAQDPSARWRALVQRWNADFPKLPQACKHMLPVLERAYGSILNNMAEEIMDNEPEALDNEFALQDFLDRYGMRLGQLGNILNLVGPIAETYQQGGSGS